MLIIVALNTNLCFIKANTEVFTNIHSNTTIVNWIICKWEVPLLRIYIAAVPPKQLCAIIAKTEEPIKL
jgi:hypothetical protein